jgi:hypothetical protein
MNTHLKNNIFILLLESQIYKIGIAISVSNLIIERYEAEACFLSNEFPENLLKNMCKLGQSCLVGQAPGCSYTGHGNEAQPGSEGCRSVLRVSAPCPGTGS